EGIRHHHEAWDGSGFPSGLRREAIPQLARIVAVAATFDVLSSERGQALPLREVEKAREARAGSELDPALVSLFINVLRQGKDTTELAKLQETDLPFYPFRDGAAGARGRPRRAARGGTLRAMSVEVVSYRLTYRGKPAGTQVIKTEVVGKVRRMEARAAFQGPLGNATVLQRSRSSAREHHSLGFRDEAQERD